MRGVDINNPMQNYWRNGNMDFFQRRITTTLTSGANYVADRVASFVGGASSKSITVAKASVIPSSNFPAANSLQVTNNTVVSSLAASDYFEPYNTKLEGQMIVHLNAGYITIGFWLWCSTAMSVAVGVKDNASTKSYITMVSTQPGMDFYCTYVPLSSIVIPNTNGIGVTINIGSIAGSSFQAPSLDTWVNGNYATHAAATNWAASTGTKFHLAQCQVRQGIVPYSEMKNTFSRHGITYDQELLDCQRYYEKSYNVNVLPGTVTNVGSHICTTPAITSTVGLMSTPFKVFKRSSAIYVSYSPLNGASTSVGANSYGTSYAVTCEGSEGCGIIVAASNFGAGQYSAHFTAESDY